MLRLPGRWLRLVWLGLFLVFVAAVALPPRLAAAQAPGGAPGAQPPGGGATPSPVPAGVAAPPDPASPAGGAQPGAGTPVQGAADPAEPTIDLAPTEAELARGQPVVQVTVAGNRRVSTEDVLVYLGQTRVGRPFTPEGLARDVRELWDSGLFDDVEVDLTRRDDGVSLRVLVRERPSIKAIEFSGNNEISSEDLTEALSVEVKPGTILSYAAIRRGVQKLRDKYAEEGYFLAEVSYEVKPERENQVTLKFTIKEHAPVTVRRITFIGNHNIPDEELREVMITGQGGFFAFGTGGPFRQDAFERDVLVINALYYDRGFLAVQVATPRVMLTPDRTGIEVTLTINEGPRFRIRSLRVYERDADGREIEPLGGRRALREMVRAKSGDWFNRAELAKDLSAIQTLYRDAGYANVEASPDTQLDPDRREVDITVGIRRNQLVYFGRIEIRGNTKTRDKVIRREMEVEERKLFSETKLERSKQRITALGYFERVDISTEQGEDAQHINVNVDIGEKPTGTFQIGAGFSSVESFIATAQVQQANLLGSGQSLSLQAQISGLRRLIDLRFFEPYLLDSPFSAAVSVYNQLRAYEEFSQTSTGGSLTLGYPLIEPELRAQLTYTLEKDEISSSTTTGLGTADARSTFQQLPLYNLFNDGITSSIRPALTYDTRNNQLFPTSGIYLQGSVELAHSAFGSQNEFLRYRATGRFYYPITDSLVLKLNTEAGMVTSPNPEGVPIFARFFLGGILDVRGFEIRDIGPRLPLRDSLDPNSPPIANGANIGGNLMYYQNLELEFPLIEAVQIKGVVFTDLGNAWNLEKLYCNAAPASPNDVTNPCFSLQRLLDVRTSWGFGLRWFSPLGPLRFEWGFPFKRLSYEEPYKFEFNIGNFF
ncbi:outer membrane protein assembly factor BamA [Sorangium sp. So ce233]|uniref:outer membrane protein assembly factor BamA n=1 Tax=Sorangium sp. So ce233 TaxID=3133290 RepID=UPI003F5F0A0F